MLRKYEVRCCCQPRKVFGTLSGPVLDAPGRFKVRLKSYYEKFLKSTHLPHQPSVKIFDYQEVEVKVMYLDPGFGMKSILAIYSEDRPIEFWRDVVGFEEFTHG